jgi:hypothetical protein
MKNKNRNNANTELLEWLDAPKPSLSAVVAHENLVGAKTIPNRRPSRNRLSVAMASTGPYGRRFPSAFCVCGTSMRVCLRAEFPLTGRIDGQSKNTLCFILKLSLLKTS